MNTTDTTTNTHTNDGVTVTTTKRTLERLTHNGYEIAVTLTAATRTYGPDSKMVEWGNYEAGHVELTSYITWFVTGLTSQHLKADLTDIDELPTQKRVAAAVAAAKKAIDRHIEDNAMRPRLAQLVNMNCETIPAVSQMPKVGDVASLYSRGTDRFGLVTKVTPSKIEIAYVTRGGLDEAARYNFDAKITRKAQPIGSVRVVA